MINKKLLLCAFLFIVLPGCRGGDGDAAADGQMKLTRVFQNFSIDRPVDFQAPPDGSGRIVIVSQPGRIYSIQTGAVPAMNVMLDLTAEVTNKSSELGLLGLAFHPRFKSNGYFYVDYTADNPLRTVIARYTMASPGSTSDAVNPSSRQILLEIPQPFENHNGGCLEFGPDGYLYIGMGDGGSAGDPRNNAQNKKSLLGKILRIDVDAPSGGKNYGIPPSNPFKDSVDAAAPEVYAYGLRNPWRFSFDPVTRQLWVADVGQDKYEEIDIVESGKNYGWRTMEGTHCYSPNTGCDRTGLAMPILDYPHEQSGGWCITGGFVYRGKNLSSLTGKYIYADFITQRVWALSRDGQGTVHTEVLFENAGGVTTFGLDADNELYLCTYDGKIFKFDKAAASAKDQQGMLLNFLLEPNYPNPFNGATVIPFTIDAPVHAVVAIYDMIGRKVETLADRFYPAGRYSLRWDAAHAASGVYTCRLTTADGATASRTLLLQK